jgi:Flp pilus assembly protein TadD
MSDRIDATERLIATLVAGQARVRHIAHARLSFAAALAIEMRAQTGLAQRWSVASAVGHEAEARPPQKHPRIAPSVHAWTEDLGQEDLLSEPVPAPEEAELVADFGDEIQPAAEEETSEAEIDPAGRGRGGVTFSEDDSDEELVQRIESRRDDDPSDEDSDDPDTEEVEDEPVAAAAPSPGEEARGEEDGGEEEGQTVVPSALDLRGDDEDDDARPSASSTFPTIGAPDEQDDLEVEDLRTGEVGDDIALDDLEDDEIELDLDSAEVELEESDADVEVDEGRSIRTEPVPRARHERTTSPPPMNEWEEEDRTMLSGSHNANEWDGEERTVLHGSEMASVLEEEDAIPGPPSRAATPAAAFDDEDDLDSVDVSEDDDAGTGAAAVRILGVGKAEPVTPKRGREEADEEPGTEEGIVAATGAEDGDDWGAGLAGAGGGLSLLGKRKSGEDDLPAIPKLTEEESQEVGGAAADGAVVDLDGGALQAVEEVDPAQLRSFQRAAEDAVAKGDMHQAIVHYRDMLDLAPENLEAYLGRGRCLVHLGDYAAAMSDFQRAEDLDPKSPLPLVEMGNLFFARKEYLRAIQFFDTALELDDKNAWAWCYRGICHHYRKKHKEAFQDLQKAYSLDPEIPNIRRYVQMAVKAMEKSTDGA